MTISEMPPAGTALQRTLDGLFTGQIQIVGAGTDIWGTADGFQFYHQTLTGTAP